MSWTDKTGRQWQVRFGMSTLERMRAAGIELLDPEAVQAKLAGSSIELLIELYRPCWEKAGLTQDQFAELVSGSLGEAADSFRQSFAAFLEREGYENYARLIRGKVVRRLVRKHGANQHSEESGRDNITSSFRGTGTDYTLRRMARDGANERAVCESGKGTAG